MTSVTALLGTYVISWSQTNVEGIAAPSPDMLTVGATWGWSGEPVKVDGPSGGSLRLVDAVGEDELRRRAAARVKHLVGAALDGNPLPQPFVEDAPELPDSSFIVTDGRETFVVTVIATGSNKAPLAMFHDAIPPAETELWIVQENLERPSATGAQDAQASPFDGGVICFTPGTRIETPEGPRLVETLREGDKVLTKDSGPQEVLWMGSRRMTGARLFAMPNLRPIRIHASAFGSDLPDTTFLVSPDHKMIVRGAVARDLFNTSEVLVSARHLINHDTIDVDINVRDVTYIHMLLPRHEVLWANGVETESFHPASASLGTLSDDDRKRLLDGLPDLLGAPQTFGPNARRVLTGSEAALLTHVA